MKKILAFVILIIGVLLLTFVSCVFNLYAAPHTLIFCFGLFVGFYLLVIAKKSDIIFWITAGITSVLVCLISMILVNFVPDNYDFGTLRPFFNPVITILTSLFFFGSVYFANIYDLKSIKSPELSFLIVAISLGTIFSTLGSEAKMAYYEFLTNTPFFDIIVNVFMMLIIFLPQGLVFSFVLFGIFVGFAKLYGFPENIYR